MTPPIPDFVFGRIDGSSIHGSMVGIHIDGWITASRGVLTVNGRPIVTSDVRVDLTASGIAGVRVTKLDDVQCDWYGDDPPMIEWSE